MSELKPCPFCGKQPKSYFDKGSLESYNEGFNITCCFSHVMGIYKHEVIEKWNKRVQK